jgi:Ca2+-binding EF-hand superfamily protein
MGDFKTTIQAILEDDAKLLQATKAVFDQVDTDGSGQIDRSELKQAMISVANQAGLDLPAEDQIDEAMRQLDRDRSGRLDLNEFKELVRVLLQGLISDEGEEATA